MTFSGDLIPAEPEYRPEPAYPVFFGISLTPVISGILLGTLGLLGATWMFFNLIQPALEKYQQLNASVQEKQAQLDQQEAIQKQLKQAEASLTEAKSQRQNVLNLYANVSTLDTILLDINRQIEQRNANLAQAKRDKLATCPAWVRDNLREVEDQAGALVAKSQLKKFTPDAKTSGIINDGSYGAALNNKLKRQTATVSFEGGFNQTQSILRSMERLQPLLLFKNVEVSLAGPNSQSPRRLFEVNGNTVNFLDNCQPEPTLTTTFQLEAPMPLTPAEMKAANPPAAPNPGATPGSPAANPAPAAPAPTP
ncbi:MAG: hypothetical protein ACKO24_12805 [Leptolyngbyaceae cyanobacterium]